MASPEVGEGGQVSSTVELVQSDTWVFQHSVTFDKNLLAQSISVN